MQQPDSLPAAALQRSLNEPAAFPRQRLAERILRDLGERIATGELSPGQLLPAEAALASHYGVSSRVIREALGALAARGLVEVRAGKGTVVRGVDSSALRDFFDVALLADQRGIWDLFELRKLIEVQIAELAARRATPGDIERCEDALHRLEDAASGDSPENYVIADIDFHQSVAAAAGNRMLGLLLEGLREPMRKARTRSWEGRIRVGHEVEDQLAMHRRILAAIKRHQPGAAASAMARHLDLAEVHLRAAETAPATTRRPRARRQ
ncbi:MAG TPA: FadR/GntR family transcriptional regulator [Candidatus Dormibacteraeota bacterium]|jgi:GntR family transcriptional repressor for pyruvate dehydrogenase complex|nr:FadR/GntR family transcriptional regulator [Candidatus Dormibacteraeota bacterium]